VNESIECVAGRSVSWFSGGEVVSGVVSGRVGDVELLVGCSVGGGRVVVCGRAEGKMSR
jgi:hypothetical protein